MVMVVTEVMEVMVVTEVMVMEGIGVTAMGVLKAVKVSITGRDELIGNM